MRIRLIAVLLAFSCAHALADGRARDPRATPARGDATASSAPQAPTAERETPAWGPLGLHTTWLTPTHIASGVREPRKKRATRP